MPALLLWLGTAWSAFISFFTTLATLKFTVAAAYLLAFTTVYLTCTAALDALAALLPAWSPSSPEATVVVQTITYVTPPNLDVYFSLIVSGYLCMITMKATFKVLGGMASS